MPDDEAWDRLPPEDRLELVAFDLELRRAQGPLIDAVWAGVDGLRGVSRVRDSRCALPPLQR